jgi:hypothetical protein
MPTNKCSSLLDGLPTEIDRGRLREPREIQSTFFRRHAVIDFVDVGWGPVFDLAGVGVIAALILAFAA